MSGVEPFDATVPGFPAVRGLLYRPAEPSEDGLVLTHGANTNCRDPFLDDLASAFADVGLTVLCCDLPYRQARPKGPPRPAGSERDRQGLQHAVAALRALCPGRMFLAGRSYGGRQASILAAEVPDLTVGLLLLSYPLHPPGQAQNLRTAHFPRLRTPALFVSGDGDPFGTPEELDKARRSIPAPSRLLIVRGGHDLGYGPGKNPRYAAEAIVPAFRDFIG